MEGEEEEWREENCQICLVQTSSRYEEVEEEGKEGKRGTKRKSGEKRTVR